MKYDQYKNVMHDGVDAAYKGRAINFLNCDQLHKSINATTDPERLKDDTLFRTGGVIGRNKAERINGIAESFHQLNRGRDGG